MDRNTLWRGFFDQLEQMANYTPCLRSLASLKRYSISTVLINKSGYPSNYRDHYQSRRCNSFPVVWNNQSRPIQSNIRTCTRLLPIDIVRFRGNFADNQLRENS